MKILVATWGDPTNWSEVTYRLDNNEFKGKTSLGVILKSVNPDITIIVGIDTIGEGKSIEEIKNKAEELLKGKIKEFGLAKFKPIIWILPGVGQFRGKIFEGEMTDFYYLLLKKLANLFLKFLKERKEKEFEVYLDITHGINYMPLLTYKALRDILAILAMTSKVFLKVYNSDPFTREAPLLKVNVVEEVNVKPSPPREISENTKILIPSKYLSSEEKKSIGKTVYKELAINIDDVKAFIGAISNGLPLAVFTFCPDNLEKSIEKAKELFYKFVSVDSKNMLKIMRKVTLCEGFSLLVKAQLIKELLGVINKKEVAFDELKKLNESIFKFDERFKERIGKDLKDIKEKEADIPKEWIVLSKVFGKPCGPVDSRNFIAHSGFERNAVEVKKEGETIMLRYKKELLKTLKDLCLRGL